MKARPPVSLRACCEAFHSETAFATVLEFEALLETSGCTLVERNSYHASNRIHDLQFEKEAENCRVPRRQGRLAIDRKIINSHQK